MPNKTIINSIYTQMSNFHFPLSESNDTKIKKVSKSKIIVDLSNHTTGYCYHCEEPKNDINHSYCCKGCEDAENRFNELDNDTNGGY